MMARGSFLLNGGLPSPLIIGDKYGVQRKSDLPSAVGGVITLPAGTAWELCADIDLEGDRLACAGACTIYGQSAESTSLTSTGLGAGQSIISSNSNLVIRALTINPPLDTTGVTLSNAGEPAADWYGVNFVGDGRGAYLADIDNFISSVMLFRCGQGGLLLDGTVNTLAITDSLIDAQAGSYGVKFETGASVDRRFRLGNSSVLAIAGGATGLDTPDATIALSEAHNLENVNFAGGGTFVSGITYLSEKARWSGCRGITNTSRVGSLNMTGNGTATVISTADTYVKIAGTTTANALNQRFDMPQNNRLTYTSAFSTTFEILIICAAESGNNQTLGVKAYKNGVEVPGFIARSTTSGSGRAEGITYSAIVQLEQDDYIEAWIKNEGSTSNITATGLVLQVREVSP